MMSDYSDADTEWVNDDVDLPAGFWDTLPKPILWRLVVMPVKAREVSKGGIVIPVSAQEAQQHLNYIGKVVALGGCAYKSAKFDGETSFPKVGDYVVYGRYAGQPMTYKGKKLLTINDDEVLCTVSDPSSLRIHI